MMDNNIYDIQKYYEKYQNVTGPLCVNETLENIGVLFFGLLFLVWLLSPPFIIAFIVINAIGGKLGTMGVFIGLAAAWLAFTIWFKKTDKERAAKAKARTHAKNAVQFDVYSDTFGVMRFDHYIYELCSNLVSPPPALFGGNTDYNVHVRSDMIDPVLVQKQLLFADSMYGKICSVISHTFGKAYYRNDYPISSCPDGLRVESLSLPISEDEAIWVCGIFTGVEKGCHFEVHIKLGSDHIKTESGADYAQEPTGDDESDQYYDE